MSKFNENVVYDLLKLKKNLEKIQNGDTEQFIASCSKELAARLLAKVIKNTTPRNPKDKQVDFIVNLPEKAVKFTTKDGKLVDFIAKAQTKHVKFVAKAKPGGTLRRGWTSKTADEAKTGTSKNAYEYAKSLSVTKIGDKYEIEIINPVPYAIYVEYGHRTPNKKGWVPGKFILTKAEFELEKQIPVILEKKIKKYLEECFRVE
jgi:DNA polymerase IIIc chi subunit